MSDYRNLSGEGNDAKEAAKNGRKGVPRRLLAGFAGMGAAAKAAVIGGVAALAVIAAFGAGIFTDKAPEKNNGGYTPPSESAEIETSYGIPAEKGMALGVVVDKFFQDAGFFRDSVCPVKINGRWGLIDEQGDFIVEPRWDYMSLCSTDGYLMVANNTGQTVVDVDGNIIPVIECGFIDTRGNTVVPMQKSLYFNQEQTAYIQASYLSDKRFSIAVYKDGSEWNVPHYYDNTGREIDPVDSEYAPDAEYYTFLETTE